MQVRTRCEVWKDFTSPTADACAAQCGESVFFALGRKGTAKCVGDKCSCVCYTKTAQDCPVEESDTLDLYKITGSHFIVISKFFLRALAIFDFYLHHVRQKIEKFEGFIYFNSNVTTLSERQPIRYL